MQAAISRCALAVVVGVVAAYAITHVPASAPASSLLPPQQPFLPLEEYVIVGRLFYGSFASTGDVERALLAPVGPDAP